MHGVKDKTRAKYSSDTKEIKYIWRISKVTYKVKLGYYGYIYIVRSKRLGYGQCMHRMHGDVKHMIFR